MTTHSTDPSEAVVIRGACHHDCPDTCVWDATVVDGRVIRLRGSPDHPTTLGGLCPKVNRYVDRVYHEERILRPLRRIGPKGSAEFEVISWDEATGEIAHRLTDVVDTSGSEAVLQYSFAGTQGAIQMGVMADRFFDTLGASDVHRHLCGVTAWLGASDVSGLPFGIDPEALRHAQTIILWGSNTRLTNRHLWPTIEEAKANGATLVVIDPIRTVTAGSPEVDRFLQIRPGTDVALVLGMVHVMVRDGLLDNEWTAERTSGWDEFRRSAENMPPLTSAAITGIEESTVEWLAHTYAANRPAAIRVLIGPEHREHGRDLMRAIAMLPAITGAWRDVGGGLARSTQIYFDEALNYPHSSGQRRTFNMAALGEVLNDETLDPPIRALIVHNCNPAVITPDQNAVVAGLERDDLFTVVVEQFVTDTARYADIVLPATTQLEHLDLLAAWGHLYLALNRPAIAPLGGALPNTEIFRRLAAAMGMTEPGFGDSDETLVRQLLDSAHPWLEGITYERLWDDGWARLNVPPDHRPNIDQPAATDDGRLILGSLTYQPGSESADGDPKLAARFPLALISRKQHPKFLNAHYGGFDKHLPAEKEPRLEIHPIDATERAINDGDAVRIFNDRGSLTLTAAVSTDVQPGLVAMPFGWWHGNGEDERGVNALTNPAVRDGIGSAAFHENLVEIVLGPPGPRRNQNEQFA
jgi:anaerobic selenocysteine-containing dehydrogenase